MLIASLVAMRAREDLLQKVLANLLQQTRPPDKIVVHYSEEPWHLDAGWDRPPLVPAHPSIEIVKVPNVGSMRKYIYTAKAYRGPGDTIVLLDDDRLWHPTVLQRLEEFVDRTGCVATTRGWTNYAVTPNADGKPILRAKSIEGDALTEPLKMEVANSGWATCFRAAHLGQRIFDTSLHEELDMRYSDEIVLSALLKPDKYVVPMPVSFYADLQTKVHQWLSPRSTQAKLKQLGRYAELRAAPDS